MPTHTNTQKRTIILMNVRKQWDATHPQRMNARYMHARTIACGNINERRNKSPISIYLLDLWQPSPRPWKLLQNCVTFFSVDNHVCKHQAWQEQKSEVITCKYQRRRRNRLQLKIQSERNDNRAPTSYLLPSCSAPLSCSFNCLNSNHCSQSASKPHQ